MISDYPLFTKLNNENLEALNQIVSQYEPYSDFNVVSLFCWAGQDDIRLARLHGNLVVQMQDYITREQITTILGSENTDSTLDVLLASTSRLVLVPGVTVDAIRGMHKYIVAEDEDNFDYIYKVSKLALMEGGDFKKKRNKLSKLKMDCGDRISVETKLLQAEDREVVLQIFDNWACENSRDAHSADSERAAIERIWKLNNKGISITYVRYDGHVVGFSINEVLDNEFAVCHFEKALKVHENIYTFLANEVARSLMAQGVRWINWEQDLGIPGLRASKSSYFPERFLKKYTIALA